MRTLHSVVKRGALYWDRDLLPPRAYEQRYAELQARIAARGDDAWLLVGDVNRHGPVVFATNFMPRVRCAMAYIPRSGPPTLFGNISSRDIPAARTITWVDDIRAFSRLPQGLVPFLKERLPGGGRIGTCGVDACLPASDWWSIEEQLPELTWVAREGEIAALRACKQSWEIAAIARAAASADDALAEAGSRMRAGASMRSVVADLDRKVRMLGAEDVRFLVASGPQSGAGLHPVDERVLGRGDCILLYCAVQQQRYWAEAARTFVLGPAAAALRALHDRADAALATMMHDARAGAGVASLVESARGLLGEGTGAEIYGLGNGIGLDLAEGPALHAGAPGRLQTDMTLAVRVILHGRDHSVAIARTLRVSEDGGIPLGQAAGLAEIVDHGDAAT